MIDSNSAADRFQWSPQPEAAAWVRQTLDAFEHSLPEISTLKEQLLSETGTRLVDWIDNFQLRDTAEVREQLESVGYASEPLGNREPRQDSLQRFVNPLGMFPPVWLIPDGPERLGIKVESVADFVDARGGSSASPQGRAGDRLRHVLYTQIGQRECLMIERHGWSNQFSPDETVERIQKAQSHLESFRNRERNFETDIEGFDHARGLIESSIQSVGPDWTCDLFFHAEREYWMRRNDAAKLQYERQSRLGMGWANHDHHTYRSSRAGFFRLIELLELMGFECRERFYAGADAGWGAQVLEQPTAGVIVFADVDLSPDEIRGDIAHQPLEPQRSLGTVGLWCALHGEAFLQAGMHHLECQFDFESARQQLAQCGAESMAPFTDFPFLRQAFTLGQRWQIDATRLEQAKERGWVSSAEADRLKRDGALGSHLEILERNDGYKGFNQTGISEIITRTDPRKG